MTATVVTGPATVLRSGPASFAQESLWLAAQARPDLPAYNSAFAVRLRGPLDEDALGTALRGILQRHEVLRSTLHLDGDRLAQHVHPVPDVVLDTVDGADPRTAAVAYANKLFDLDGGPLLRMRLLRVAPGDAVLLLVVHHLAWDAGSMRVFLDELVAGYTGSAVPRPEFQYLDHAARERATLTGGRLATHLDWFRDRLTGLPAYLDLPTDRPRPAVRDHTGATEPLILDAATSDALRALARAGRTTLSSVLLAAVQATLARYAATDDVAVGLATVRRPQPDLESLIGCFVNPMVLRQHVTPGMTLRELARAGRGELARSLDHQELPFDRLVHALAPDRTGGDHPLFQVMFSFQQTPARTRRMGGVDVTVEPVDKGLAKFDLSFVLEAAPGEPITGLLSYSTELFDPATACALVTHVQRLLRAGAGAPDTPLDRLPVLTPTEETALLAAPDTDPTADLATRFASVAASAPQAVAVHDAVTGREVTYQTIDDAAAALAGTLRAADLPAEGVVAIGLDLGVDAAVAALAVLYAGGAFFFCPADHPPALWRRLVSTHRAAAVITDRAGAARLGAVDPLVVLLDAPAAGPAVRPRPVRPDRLACISFTSGSTGEPKGVLLTHGGLAGYLAAVAAEQGLTPADRMVWKANLAFDAAVAELLQPLLLGATAVLLDQPARTDPAALAAGLATHRVTVLGLPAMTLRGLAREPGLARCTDLRVVSSGGEAMQRPVVDAFHERSPARLLNRYGPSEASVAVTTADPADGTGDGTVPLGRARAGARVCVLDPHRHLVPPGVVGEIFVGGPALARGYSGRPGLTAKAFVPDPYRPGERLYATGDRGRYRPDGSIAFAGRADSQLKIRGVRIEPAAVAAALQNDPAVRAAAVTVHDTTPGAPDGRVLVAHVEPADPARCDPARLRHDLLDALPPHLVPAVVRVHDRLPRTRAGKIDVRQLATTTPDLAGTDDSVPRTRTEIRLAAIWARLLGREPIPAATSFFALGGHSLLALRLANTVRDQLGHRLSLRDVLEHPTIAALSTLLDTRPAAPTDDPITPSARREPTSPSGERRAQ